MFWKESQTKPLGARQSPSLKTNYFLMKGDPMMRNNLVQQYEVVKAEYKAVQKTRAELEAREAALQNSLIRLNLCIQFEDKHLTRPIPVGDFRSYWQQS
jgi:hypothetical protein